MIDFNIGGNRTKHLERGPGGKEIYFLYAPTFPTATAGLLSSAWDQKKGRAWKVEGSMGSGQGMGGEGERTAEQEPSLPASEPERWSRKR